jgi:hypothetical protein
VKSAIVPAAGLALALAGCATSTSPVVASSKPAASAHSAGVTTPAAGQSGASDAGRAARRCEAKRPASGDIYVRMQTAGTATVAQQLGGEWVWNVSTGKCLTSVQMMIATAPSVPGACTWVGYVTDNPGYDVNATPAPPLRNVAVAAGPAC